MLKTVILILIFTSSSLLSQVGISINHIGTYHTYAYEKGAAEITAHHPASQQLFVVNANSLGIDILDINDPANPKKVSSIDLSSYGAGVNSVDVTENLLVIALENYVKQENGAILFYDISEKKIIHQATAGALPDMVKASHSGKYIVSANEGEPNADYSNDPEGSLTIVEILEDGSYDVIQVSFNKYDGMKETLINKGIKIFGSNASVSEDLEPEYIAFSEDDKFAYITCQENNCIAVLDVANKEIIDLMPLGYKLHKWGQANLQKYNLNEIVADWPELGKPHYGNKEPIKLGGFSGIFVDQVESNSMEMIFYLIPDRGPNDSSVENPNGGKDLRPFLLPEYQSRIAKFKMNLESKNIELIDEIFLSDKNGNKISGRGNIDGVDEVPVTVTADGTNYNRPDFTIDGVSYHKLDYEAYSGDFEGIVKISGKVSSDGFWLCDEYRPSFSHFDFNGKLIDRYVPIGTAELAGEPIGTYGKETLPVAYSKRRDNRGFEAVAWDYDKNIIYGFVQSPLETAGKEQIRDNSDVIRIIGINPENGEALEEYVYLLENNKNAGHNISRVDKIGDAVYIGNGKFGIIERDGSDTDEFGGKKYIFIIDLNKSTNIIGTNISNRINSSNVSDKKLEMMTAEDLKSNNIIPAYKIKLVNLPSIGYLPTSKAEGLGFYSKGGKPTFVTMSDNDFGLAGSGETDNSQLGLISFDNNEYSFDASNRDAGFNLMPWNVLGSYQPDGIASFSIGGNNYFLTANEGDTRNYDGYSEEVRVKNIDLDNSYFEDAIGNGLLEDKNLGRLYVSNAQGDIDGDGEFEYLYSFGARSMSIFDEYGNLIHDTGNDFAREIHRRYPDNFNSNHSNDSFDSRSDDKGSEPENVVVGEIYDGTYWAFVGLERMSGFMAYDITDIHNIQFIDYINTRDFAFEFDEDDMTNQDFEDLGDVGPEGIIFIKATDSPTGLPLVVTSNEISGSTSIFEITLPTGVEHHKDKGSLIKYTAPNPFDNSTTLFFELLQSSDVEITVTDMNGTELINHNKNYMKGECLYDIRGNKLSSGIYLVSVKANDKVDSTKIIKR